MEAEGGRTVGGDRLRVGGDYNSPAQAARPVISSISTQKKMCADAPEISCGTGLRPPGSHQLGFFSSRDQA